MARRVHAAKPIGPDGQNTKTGRLAATGEYNISARRQRARGPLRGHRQHPSALVEIQRSQLPIKMGSERASQLVCPSVAGLQVAAASEETRQVRRPATGDGPCLHVVAACACSCQVRAPYPSPSPSPCHSHLSRI